MQRAGELFESVLTLQEDWEAAVLLDEEESPSAKLLEISRCCRGAPSSRHGLGLFAATNLAANTVATFYPVHSLGVGDFGAALKEDTEYFASLPGPSEYRMQPLHQSLRDWAPNLFIDVNPNREHVPGWIGHLANDASCTSGTSEAEALDYYDRCSRLCNAVLLPFGEVAPIMALCTTRSISEGEELLISYGHSYWFEQAAAAAKGANGEEPPTDDAVENSVGIRAACERQGAQMAEVERQVLRAYEVELRVVEQMLMMPALE